MQCRTDSLDDTLRGMIAVQGAVVAWPVCLGGLDRAASDCCLHVVGVHC